jgi:hypothetical protein
VTGCPEGRGRECFFEDGLRFGCTQCGQCCTGAHGIIRVEEDEVRALAASLGLTVAVFTRRFLYRIRGGYSIRERRNGNCMFLRDGRCTVYALRPVQCRTYPFWFENVRSERAWARTATECPGIGEGRRYGKEEVLGIVRASRGLAGAPDAPAREA